MHNRSDVKYTNKVLLLLLVLFAIIHQGCCNKEDTYQLFRKLLPVTTSDSGPAVILGPTNIKMVLGGETYTATGANGTKVECKTCQIDCLGISTPFVDCQFRYYRYGCYVNEPCANTDTASNSEYYAATAMCLAFNNCTLDEKVCPQGNCNHDLSYANYQFNYVPSVRFDRHMGEELGVPLDQRYNYIDQKKQEIEHLTQQQRAHNTNDPTLQKLLKLSSVLTDLETGYIDQELKRLQEKYGQVYTFYKAKVFNLLELPGSYYFYYKYIMDIKTAIIEIENEKQAAIRGKIGTVSAGDSVAREGGVTVLASNAGNSKPGQQAARSNAATYNDIINHPNIKKIIHSCNDAVRRIPEVFRSRWQMFYITNEQVENIAYQLDRTRTTRLDTFQTFVQKLAEYYQSNVAQVSEKKIHKTIQENWKEFRKNLMKGNLNANQEDNSFFLFFTTGNVGDKKLLIRIPEIPLAFKPKSTPYAKGNEVMSSKITKLEFETIAGQIMSAQSKRNKRECNHGFVQKGRCYIVDTTTKRDKKESSEYCSSLNKKLATFRDFDDQRLVSNACNNQEFWTGYSNPLWEDGTPVASTVQWGLSPVSTLAMGLALNGNNNNRNKKDTPEPFAFNAYSDVLRRTYLTKTSISAVKLPCTACQSMVGCSGTLFRDRCYRVFAGSTKWSKARAKCRSLGGDLVSIRDSSENKFVTDLIRDKLLKNKPKGSHACAFIGLRARVSEYDPLYVWSDTSDFGYTNWASAVKPTAISDEYVIVCDDGLWRQVSIFGAEKFTPVSIFKLFAGITLQFSATQKPGDDVPPSAGASTLSWAASSATPANPATPSDVTPNTTTMKPTTKATTKPSSKQAKMGGAVWPTGTELAKPTTKPAGPSAPKPEFTMGYVCKIGDDVDDLLDN